MRPATLALGLTIALSYVGVLGCAPEAEIEYEEMSPSDAGRVRPDGGVSDGGGDGASNPQEPDPNPEDVTPDGSPPTDRPEQPQAPSNFVTVDRTNARFVLNGKPFYFAGANFYWLMQQRAYDRPEAQEAFNAASALGLRVIRTWAFSDGRPEDRASLQPSLGQFNEQAFTALDWVVAEAGKRNIKLVLTLVNGLPDYGGMPQYMAWLGGGGKDQFYTNDKAIKAYKAYIDRVLGRVNTITRVAYKDDPAIMAWEIANEARNPSDRSGDVVAKWYTDIAGHIKTRDKKHLVTTGEEGFDVDRNGYSNDYDNQYPHSGDDGTSFKKNTAIADIDFASAHLYPVDWKINDSTASTAWIRDHIEIARKLGKPLMLGEYGNRNDKGVYESWLKQMETSKGGGDLVWQIRPTGRDSGDAFDVYYPSQDRVIDVIKSHATRMTSQR